ncbi:MAG: hypothetical protein AAF741_11855 [Bacteroidota bacterium]
MNSKFHLPTVVLTFLFTVFSFTSTLFAGGTELLKPSSRISFVYSEMDAVAGETVEVCLERKIDPFRPATELVRILPDKKPYFTKRKETPYEIEFLIGVKQVCLNINIPTNHHDPDMQLELEGYAEYLKINITQSQTGWCGAPNYSTNVDPEFAFATDNYGNQYSAEMISTPKSEEVSTLSESSLNTNCRCSELGFSLEIFEPFFEDCIYDTNEGFDDSTPSTGGQTKGELRIEVLCTALSYLESLIVPNPSICNPLEEVKVNLKILPSNTPENYPIDLFPMSPNILGYASPFYDYPALITGIRHPWTWQVINSGEYPTNPFIDDFFHAMARFNFSGSINWNLDYTDDDFDINQQDFYTIALHEMIHTLGFGTSFNSNLFSQLGNRFGIGLYNHFDQFLQIEYPSNTTLENLIINTPSSNSLPFSHEWYFNENVDGNIASTGDLLSSCPGPGPDITFNALNGSHPIFTGTVFRQGSTLNHLDGRCNENPQIDKINFIMNPSFEPGSFSRLLHGEELDILLTLGYTIECNNSNTLDSDPLDNFEFDCNQIDESCSVASVNDFDDNLIDCGSDISTLKFPTCPGQNQIQISIQDLENILLENDPGASEIAFIQPMFSSSIGSVDISNGNLTITTSSWNNFMFYYSPTTCNGAVSNFSEFSISTFPGPDCEIPSCELMSCGDFNVPEDWLYCETFDQCEISTCNLVCNGNICATIASNIEGNPIDYFGTSVMISTNVPEFDVLTQNQLISVPGWIRSCASSDVVVGDIDNPPALGLTRLSFSSNSYVESFLTYIKNNTEANTNYLYSSKFHNIFPWPDDVPQVLNTAVRLINGQNVGSSSFVTCYAPNTTLQTIIEPTEADIFYPGNNTLRVGSCFTADNSYNALLVETTADRPSPYFQTYEAIDNVELIADNFSAGDGAISDICSQIQTLGGTPFCMLSDVGVEYAWYELDENDDIIEPALFTHTQEDINLGNPISFAVAPERTTTYRIVRTITDLAGLPQDFEFCTTEDDVTITVIEQLPIPDFTFNEVNCGVYDFISDPTSVGDNHTWYLNEQLASNVFSNEFNPDDVQLPNGTHTIIHVVSNDCGFEIFELDLPSFNCDVSIDCNCTTSNSISLSAGNGTNLSDFISNGTIPAEGVTNQCISISGHLIVDEAANGVNGSYRFGFSEVQMQAGSKITIESGAALFVDYSISGGLHGCDELWQGIHLSSPTGPLASDGGRLRLNHANVQDAIHAVYLNDETTFEAWNTTLDKNHIGIYAPPTQALKIINQPTPIVGTIISASEDLLPPYSGQNVSTNNISYAGIELNDCAKLFTIGSNQEGIEIKDVHYGIKTSKSYVHISNSRIHDLVSYPGDFIGSSGFAVSNRVHFTLSRSCPKFRLKGDDQRRVSTTCRRSLA